MVRLSPLQPVDDEANQPQLVYSVLLSLRTKSEAKAAQTVMATEAADLGKDCNDFYWFSTSLNEHLRRSCNEWTTETTSFLHVRQVVRDVHVFEQHRDGPGGGDDKDDKLLCELENFSLVLATTDPAEQQLLPEK
ncbi:hypothetical protein BOX15_Mlig001427g4 [Macrostomum lignano]|uniref:Uncharacterized protein n=1 Tax=Macrostomum lignano TaxID=282301 RepID=A0A267GC31_9PLAT|nr:hypothetical protein BOX15_Mlig001427g4 [Macrostomum lignano]